MINGMVFAKSLKRVVAPEGIGIIRRYVLKNPNMNFHDLVLTPQSRLIRFANQEYGKL